MNLKTRFWLGLGTLTLMLALVMGTGIFTLLSTQNAAVGVTEDNLRTVQYAREMVAAVQNFPAPAAYARFEDQLALEHNNITEPGEQELANEITRTLAATRTDTTGATRQALISLCLRLQDMNLAAIEAKNQHLENTSQYASRLMLSACTLAFLVLITVLYNLPGAVLRPVRVLTEKIRSVADGNYDQRVEFAQQDEIGTLAEAFNQMAAKLLTYQRSNLARLMFEQKRTEAMLEALHDALVVLDEDRKLLYINPVAEDLTGLLEARHRGIPAAEAALQHDLLRTLLNYVDAPPQPDAAPLCAVMRGREQFFQPYAVAVDGTDPNTGETRRVGYVLGLHNVTHFHELDAAKTAFMATVSHELKTPLSSINLSLKLLEDPRVGVVNPEQQALYGNIREETQRLLKLVGELLNLAQLESGRIQLHPTSAPVPVLLNQAADTLRFQAQQKEVQLVVQLPPEPLPPVRADVEKTIWLLTNLLGNALRYTPARGEIHLSAQIQGETVRFAITDQGPGIPLEYQQQIFEKFFRLPADLAKPRTGGTGLGLAISREFIEAQGGCIGVESEPGRGSIFWFTLPMAVLGSR